jgi:hypothetical protein
MKITNITTSILLFFTLSPTTVMALPFEFGGKLGLESLNWKELDQNGQKTEQETGVRYIFSAFLHSKAEPKRLKPFIYGAEIKLYTAATDYTDTDYESNWAGASIEGEVGLRVGNMPFAWEFVAKPGYDTWIRSMDDNLDVTTRVIQAKEEQYDVLNLGLGTGPAWHLENWYGRLIAGFKYSSARVNIQADQSVVYKSDLEFDIDGKTTGFAAFSNSIQITKKILVKIDAYYDTYHFKRSDTKTVDAAPPYEPTSEVTIPERKQTTYGVHAGVSMDF